MYRNQRKYRGDARSVLNEKRGGTDSTQIFTNRFGSERSYKPYGRKQVKVARDGNITVTTKSLGSVTSKGLPWAEPETDIFESLQRETMLINPLPVLNVPPLQRRAIVTTSIANNIPNTMIADQYTRPMMQQSNKVIISNLGPNIFEHDVLELFSALGEVKSVKMFPQGRATIEYFDSKNASHAIRVYNNRPLDGIPMKCCLQSCDMGPVMPSISQRLGERLSNSAFVEDFEDIY